MTRICVIGDGILGATTCLELAKLDCEVTWVKKQRSGAASPAAAAMLNSFAEIDNFTFRSRYSKTMFDVSIESTKRWPSLYREVLAFSRESGKKELSALGMGTYVLNNTVSDSFEDASFDLILSALEEFEQPHLVNLSPDKAMLENGYFPDEKHRALRSLFIENEGFFNPKEFLAQMDAYLENVWNVKTKYDDVISLNINLDEILIEFISNEEKFDKLVNCAGVWSDKIKDKLGFGDAKAPKLFSGVGVSVELKCDIQNFNHCIRTPNRGGACGIYVAPYSNIGKPDQSFVVGASNMMSLTPQYEAKAKAVSHLIESASREINQKFEDATLSSVNVGNRPITSDLYPLIGQYDETAAYVLTGTRRDGLHCAPVLSREIAHLVVNGKYDQFDLSFCSPLREPILDISRETAIEENISALLSEWYQHGFSVASYKQIKDFSSKLRHETELILDQYELGDKGLHPHILKIASKGAKLW